MFHVRLPGGESVAAQIGLLGDHPVSRTVCAAIDPADGPIGAAACLRWRTFEWFALRRKTANDLTEATAHSVTHFKSQLGGNLVTNLFVETRGSMAWRAASELGGAYSGLLHRTGAFVQRIRKHNSE